MIGSFTGALSGDLSKEKARGQEHSWLLAFSAELAQVELIAIVRVLRNELQHLWQQPEHGRRRVFD